MTIKDYIKSKFQTFGIQMSEADLLDVWIGDTGAELTAEIKQSVEIGIANFIPQLLLRPQSVSEGGFSMSFNANALKDYYSYLCSYYGLLDQFKPTIRFK
jgi:hypothetical protein